MNGYQIKKEKDEAFAKLEAERDVLKIQNQHLTRENTKLRGTVKKLEDERQNSLDMQRAEKFVMIDLEVSKYKEIIDNLAYGYIQVADWMNDCLMEALEEKIEKLEMEKANLRMWRG